MICHSTSSQILQVLLLCLSDPLSSYLLSIILSVPTLGFTKAVPKSPTAPLVNHYEGLIQTDMY